MDKLIRKLQGFDTWLGLTTDARCYTELFEKGERVQPVSARFRSSCRCPTHEEAVRICFGSVADAVQRVVYGVVA